MPLPGFVSFARVLVRLRSLPHGDCGVIDLAIIRSRNPLPVPAFGEHFKDTPDHDTGACEGQLTVADFRVSDGVVSKFFAFARGVVA